jgi:hypothetical protein
MKYIITPLIGLLLALVSLVVAPVGMLFAVWFIKWDTEPSAGSYADDPTVPKIVRGDLPWWLSWFSTPDERCPCNSFEPAMMGMLETYGKTFTTYWNLGWRNQMMGLAAALGKETIGYIPETPNGFWTNGDTWRYSLPLGPIRIVAGWQVYRRLDQTFLAVPVLTLKKN